MQEHFYGPIEPSPAVAEENRHWLEPGTMNEVAIMLDDRPVDLVLGGWAQDGHVA
jgi:glucosamine-6-phosphate deaminase